MTILLSLEVNGVLFAHTAVDACNLDMLSRTTSGATLEKNLLNAQLPDVLVLLHKRANNISTCGKDIELTQMQWQKLVEVSTKINSSKADKNATSLNSLN